MKLARVLTRALAGVHAPEVIVEVHISSGLPAFSIVGLPEAAVRESKDRVRAAVMNSGFDYPMQRITVSLAPADLPKTGGRYDLPIAIGILAASDQIDTTRLSSHEFHGELALSGKLRCVSGVLPATLAAHKAGHVIVVPADNRSEAGLVEDCDVRSADDLLEVTEYLKTGELDSSSREGQVVKMRAADNGLDYRDVRGQFKARRAIEIAAAGGHNLLMIGPPGTGKSMIASRLPTILPEMSDEEALETASIGSISNRGFDPERFRCRPFRAPHHTASGIALVGGGSIPAPGEISLAHNGVLFLDELTEFERKTLDALREPLETGTVSISRAARQAEFPARFQLIAAMNPCPQGYTCDGGAGCGCSLEQQRKHRSRISAPLLDRIDMHVEVPRQGNSETTDVGIPESSDTIRRRVELAYQRQQSRAGKQNAALNPSEMKKYCCLSIRQRHILDLATEKLGLSARAHDRILKLARTIADLCDSEKIEDDHLTEAIGYRSLDRLLN